MNFRRVAILLLAVAAVFGVMPRGITPAQAADTPAVTVTNQAVEGGTVVISKVVATGPSWIAIHNSDGPVIGETFVPAGTTENVVVQIDLDNATPQLSAMLHEDTGKAEVYEFDGKNGLDNPVKVNGQLVNPTFKIIAADVDDQFVADAKTVTVGKVIAQVDGWIVIHNQTGKVAGYAAVKAGVNEDVAVTVDPSIITAQNTAMLHDDTGAKGKYEFDGKNGLDLPSAIAPKGTNAALGGGIVNEPFWTVDHIRAMNQVVTDTVVVPYVLAKVDGWVVIHNSDGPGIGQAPVKAGLNQAVSIKIDASKITAKMTAMLHVDDGTKGTYEFDGKSGKDNPVMIDGQAVNPPFYSKDGVWVSDQKADQIKKDGFVQLAGVLSAQDGWMVIHAKTASGAPVLGETFLHIGWNPRVIVKVKTDGVTDTLIAMMHVDDGKAGVYEFDGKSGKDNPTQGDGAIVSPTFNTGAAKAAAPTAAPTKGGAPAPTKGVAATQAK